MDIERIDWWEKEGAQIKLKPFLQVLDEYERKYNAPWMSVQQKIKEKEDEQRRN